MLRRMGGLVDQLAGPRRRSYSVHRRIALQGIAQKNSTPSHYLLRKLWRLLQTVLATPLHILQRQIKMGLTILTD